MGRRTEIHDRDILEAARHVFLSRGVHATTLEVARRASISEASIFKRFKSKSALFCAAMTPCFEIPPALATLPARAGKSPLAATLEEAGGAVLEVMRVVLPATMMAWSNRADGRPEVEDAPAIQKDTLGPLVSYARNEMALGRLRAGDPEVFARAFVGGIADYVVTETLGYGIYPTALSPQKYIRGLVDLILNGAAATNSARRHAIAPRKKKTTTTNRTKKEKGKAS